MAWLGVVLIQVLHNGALQFVEPTPLHRSSARHYARRFEVILEVCDKRADQATGQAATRL